MAQPRFDRRVMAPHAALYGLPPIEMQAECAMLLYAEYADEWDDYRGSYRWHKLINAARREGVVIEVRHPGLGRCAMTSRDQSHGQQRRPGRRRAFKREKM